MSNQGFSRSLTLIETGGFNTATTLLNTVTSGAGAKGSWTEIIASTSELADCIVVYLVYDSGTAVEDLLVDIGIGGSGSEVVLIENLYLSGRVIYNSPFDVMSFPITVPSGSRISARVGSDTGTAEVGVGIGLYKGGEKSYSYRAAKGFGIDLANWTGTQVDPGGTANTKGAWTELTASSSDDIKGFWLSVGLNENLTINVSTANFIDVGIGAASSEQVIVENHTFMSNTSEAATQSIFYDIFIPAGTRIVARMQTSDTDATDRVKNIALIGLI